MVDQKLQKLLKAKEVALSNRKKTVKEQEMDIDQNLDHFNQMVNKRKQYAVVKKEINRMKRELSNYIYQFYIFVLDICDLNS